MRILRSTYFGILPTLSGKKSALDLLKDTLEQACFSAEFLDLSV